MDWFKLFPKDFISGTAGMTVAEIGVYQLLLSYQWDRGGRLPADPDEILELLPRSLDAGEFRQMWDGKVGRKFELDEGGYFNRRLERERLKAHESAARRSRAAQKAATARWDSDAERMRSASEGHAERMPSASESHVNAGVRDARLSSLSSEDLDSSSGGEEPEEGGGLRWRLLREFEAAFGVTVSPGGCGYLDERLAAGGTYEQAMAVLRYVQQRPGYHVGRPNDVWSAANWNAVHARRRPLPEDHGSRPVASPPPAEQRPEVHQTPEAASRWERVLELLGETMDPHTFDTWVRPACGVETIDAMGEPIGLVVAVPNEIFEDWLQRRHADQIAEAAGVDAVEFVVARPVRLEQRREVAAGRQG